jgi:hypothetical protein
MREQQLVLVVFHILNGYAQPIHRGLQGDDFLGFHGDGEFSQQL